MKTLTGSFSEHFLLRGESQQRSFSDHECMNERNPREGSNHSRRKTQCGGVDITIQYELEVDNGGMKTNKFRQVTTSTIYRCNIHRGMNGVCVHERTSSPEQEAVNSHPKKVSSNFATGVSGTRRARGSTSG